MRSSPGAPRYRFSGHTLSIARRTLVRDGRELPLIPRCFDLLVLLVERRHEALSRREILDAVWSDVVVTDGALSQAIRILRRTLGDDPRALDLHPYGAAARLPLRVQRRRRRTGRGTAGARAGRGTAGARAGRGTAGARAGHHGGARRERLLRPGPQRRLLDDDADDAEGADVRRRQAAETLHELGTAEALDRLNRKPVHAAVARAYLRETRWDVPGAGPVPLLGHPGWLAAAQVLLLLRIRRVARLAGRRWMAAAAGGAASGAIAGFLGGLVLRFGPAVDGGQRRAGDAGRFSERRSAASRPRGSGPVWLPRKPPFARGGGWPSPSPGHRAVWRSAQPRTCSDASCSRACSVETSHRWPAPWKVWSSALRSGWVTGSLHRSRRAAWPPLADSPGSAFALLTGLACAVAAGMLGWSGRFLGAMSLDFMAQSFPGSQVGLAPLARLLGEQEPGDRDAGGRSASSRA